MEQKLNMEIFILRSVACISIALLHCLNRVYVVEPEWEALVGLLLTFGTPMFVFISEFVLSFSYQNRQPAHFWSKRVKYILLPYICFGTIYALLKAEDLSRSDGSPLLANVLYFLWRHIILGDYHGYFILVIFQFYLLHHFLRKALDRYSPQRMIVLSFIVNMLYLSFFNFVTPPNTIFAHYLWDKLYWLPFPGWLLYFVIAYYLGRNYEWFKQQLIRFKWIVLLLPIATAAIVLFDYEWGWLTMHSSKRIDMVFFTISMIFLLYYTAALIKTVPRSLLLISRYSFGIYLIHPLLLVILAKILPSLSLMDKGIFSVFILLFGCVLGSIFLVFLLHKVPIGPFIIGRAGVGLPSRRSLRKREWVESN
ncbi:MAG: hypothetical protein JWM44_4461 [Bacilli bacterium]|nr:hypothetical protein [Bacilli bacterium]